MNEFEGQAGLGVECVGVMSAAHVFLSVGLLSTAAACKVDLAPLDQEKLRPLPVRAPSSPRLLAFQRTTYDVCPNYFLAIEILKKKLGSSSSEPVQCVPSPDPRMQRCQRALRGCNVCAKLVDGSGPGLDWASDYCDGEYDHDTEMLSVCNDLCSKYSPEDLAAVLLHETIHHCQREGFGEPKNDCQAYQAEEACFGKPFPRAASVCFPIP